MPEKADFDPSNATVAELIAEVLTLRSDLALIGAEFVREAHERDWCGDYERWARLANKKLSRPWFVLRTDLNREPRYDEATRFEPVAAQAALDETGRFQRIVPPRPDGDWTWCESCWEWHRTG